MATKERKVGILLSLALMLNILFWFSGRDIEARWVNVPPAPGVVSAAGGGLGDLSFAFRSTAVMLQNLGEWKGEGRFLDEYNYANLEDWLFLQHALDPVSDHTPSLAAMYFGLAKKPENLKHLVEYLHLAGSSPEGEKWRWLAQAVYILRYKLEDYDRAFAYAQDLAALNEHNPDMPAWTRQMPAFIKNTLGEKEAAYEIMARILEYEAENIHPAEAYHTAEYICTRILDHEQAAEKPFCEEFLNAEE